MFSNQTKYWICLCSKNNIITDIKGEVFLDQTLFNIHVASNNIQHTYCMFFDGDADCTSHVTGYPLIRRLILTFGIYTELHTTGSCMC